ncbi:hypothetical protein [Flavivirga jejuensis]|uniref:Uncharacterized protein n=1 Tax=Flavivirga jejuensis TaxID=870487 RepID=A0ABT8WW23_9FLAO|nr:hypothetical protein [Flavivirga jejuensis]MDO5977096.1 hypothetical protein [Flavivirga jejuensis]
MTYLFNKLKLQRGELISLTNEGGEVFTGTYESENNNSSDTFQFSNFSNGQLETICIEKLQGLQRI